MSSASASLATTSQIFSSKRQCRHRRCQQGRPAAFITRSKAELREEDRRHENNARVQSSRRDALRVGIAAAASALLAGPSIRPVIAAEGESENNGYWLNGPLPVPKASNKLANEATGTRSFLQQGVYVANVGPDISAYKVKSLAFDLLALGDVVGRDDFWPYMRRYLCLKATLMYYAFDTVISGAPADQKQPLTDLANRVFDSFEKMLEAIKKRDVPMTESSYRDTTGLLQEVMDKLEYCSSTSKECMNRLYGTSRSDMHER